MNEIFILKKLDHHNLLKLYETFSDGFTTYVVTEMCRGKELFDEIIEKGSYSEKEAANRIKQILQGIQYCHKENIVHRDIKPENVIINASNDSIKIIDFGSSVSYQV